MLSGNNILCISTRSWSGNYANTTIELLKILAQKNKVLYVNSSYTVKDVIDGIIHKKDIPLKQIFGLKNRITRHSLNNNAEVYVLNPPMTLTINFLPAGFLYDRLLQVNGWLIKRSIKRALKRLQMEEDLVNIVAFNPSVGLVTARQFDEKVLIYHCYDEIEAASHLKKHGGRLEKALMKKADAVIVTSQGLLEKKEALARSCYLVKNAADIKLFKTGFNPDVINQQKKQVGFIGSLDDRVDYELLKYVIEELPDFNFVFIGRIASPENAAALQQFKNVELLGAKSLEELPSYVRNFSAGIIPFIKSEFTKGIYPLKINEYLAAGVPVVTTDFSYLQDFEPVIRIATNKEQFKTSLLEEIRNDSIDKKTERVNLAKANSWEHRVEELSAIISELSARKKNKSKEVLSIEP